MARQVTEDPRFDYRGGVNTAFSEELLDSTELRLAQNYRGAESGSLVKRLATQRIHTAQLESGASVMGLYQWDAPGGSQVVAVCNGHFFHKLHAAADFTKVASTLSTANRPVFAPHRIGANIVLYFADGALRKWDGTTLTTTIASAPALTWVVLYKGRLFGGDGTKRLYWSAIGAPEEWAVANGAGFADVETFDTEGIQRGMVVGSSQVLWKEDNIARFTGNDKRNIRIDTETEGVSPKLGLLATACLFPIEAAALFLTDRGFCIADEANVQKISQKIKDQFRDANKAYLTGAVGIYLSDREEAWVSYPYGAETQNLTTWIYSLELGSWYGPFVFNSFGCCTLAEYERSDETQTVLIGGYDGWIREVDAAGLTAKDDVLKDGTGGNNISGVIELPPLMFGDPGRMKDMAIVQNIEMECPSGGSLDIDWSTELGSGSVTIAGRGAGVRDYQWKSECKGRRISLTLTEDSGKAHEITGILSRALLGSRKS